MIKQLVIVFFFAWILNACTQSNAIELQGRLAVKGTAPHSYLVIEDSLTKKSYRIKNSSFNDLINKQKQSVKLKAQLLKDAIGPGFPAVIEVIKILK